MIGAIVVLMLRKKGVKMSELPETFGNSVRSLGIGGFDNPGYGAEFQNDKVTLDTPQAQPNRDTEDIPMPDSDAGASSV